MSRKSIESSSRQGIAPASVAQFLWVQGALSPLEQLCLQSFVDHGHAVHLYVYHEVTGVPSAVELRDAREVLPAECVFEATAPGGLGFTSFSNRFRYHLLAERGGWWFDTDVVCLKPIPAPRTLEIASTWEGEWGQCPVGCVLWCDAGDVRVIALRDRCEEILAEKRELEFGRVGTFLVQNFVKEHSLHDSVAPWWKYCPYPWRLIQLTASADRTAWLKDVARHLKHRVWETWSSRFRGGRLRSGSYALHLHTEIWRARGMDKNGRYYRHSVFEQLKRQHGIGDG